MADFIVVDVGASNGEFSEFILQNINSSKVHAVEPNMVTNFESLDALKLKYGNRISIHPYALAEESGYRQFFGSSQINGQIGSLRKFNSEKKWNEYLDQLLDKNELASSTLVPVKSVSDFLNETKIDQIDFLKIDAQGYDVELLKEFLEACTIECLVLEVNSTPNLSENIYEGDNNLNALIPIIHKHNLKIVKIVPHSDLSELNIFLSADFQKGQKILNYLKMSSCPTFEQYWSVIVKSSSKAVPKITFPYILNSFFKLITHPRIYSKKIYERIATEI